MAYGISTLKIGTCSMGRGAKSTVTLADFTPAATKEMENHFKPNPDIDPAGGYPYSLDFSSIVSSKIGIRFGH